MLNCLSTWFEQVRRECNIRNEPSIHFSIHSVSFLCHVGLSRLGMDDLNSDEDEDEFAVSANSSFTPSTFPLTVTSCTSTQVEPSTPNKSLDNTCRVDDILETVSPPKASETQTAMDDCGKDKTTVVQDEVKLSQTTSKEDTHTEGRYSASDKDTEKESCEKVCTVLLSSHPHMNTILVEVQQTS